MLVANVHIYRVPHFKWNDKQSIQRTRKHESREQRQHISLSLELVSHPASQHVIVINMHDICKLFELSRFNANHTLAHVSTCMQYANTRNRYQIPFVWKKRFGGSNEIENEPMFTVISIFHCVVFVHINHALFKRVEKVLNRKWYMNSLVDGIW